MSKKEFKQRVQKAVERLINAYYGENNLVDVFTNSTLKVLLSQNLDKMDDFLCMFEDENGDIDAQQIVNTYIQQISETGIPFDLRNFVKNDTIKAILPNKSLIIKKTDLMKILE